MTERKMEYRVTYPSSIGGTLDDEVDVNVIQRQDNLELFLAYLRGRSIPFQVEFREWTPTPWTRMGVATRAHED